MFGYPGGAVLPIYDALFGQNKVRHVLVRHEQGAAHAAEGYARSTGKVGVLLVTSGPGATNAITGLTDALMDSIPLVCITGQVPTHLIGSDAFQECDTTGITRSCTKHNYLVRRVEDLPRILHEAFYVASHGRPGPVVIDMPKDVQFAHRHLSRSRATSSTRPISRAEGRRRARSSSAIEMMTQGEEADLLYRRRRHQFRPERLDAAARTRAADRLPDHLDADGAGRLSRRRTSNGSACSACTARSRPTSRCTIAI